MLMRRAIGGCAALFLAAALVACTSDGSDGEAQDGAEVPVIAPQGPGEPNETRTPDEAASAAQQQPPNDADVSYVQMMIVHHAQALEMTELAAEHGTGEKVRSIAARISDVQGPEIDMMNRWLAEHGEDEIDPSGGAHDGHGNHGHHGDMPGMATPEEMDDLRAARGEDFDELFLTLMIAHHDGALEMARDVQTAGADVRVQEMADDVIATQSAEIGRMQTMRDR
jgi:uncharacterized protein (DUF305 family)